MNKLSFAVFVTAMPLAGCADLTPGRRRALPGTAIGAAGGAAIGAMAGDADWAPASARGGVGRRAADQRLEERSAEVISAGLPAGQQSRWLKLQ